MKPVIRSAWLAFAVLLGALPALAQDLTPTPITAQGVQVISVEQARDLVGNAYFFDMRAALNFGKGHIKGAVAVPYNQKSAQRADFDGSMDKFDRTRLPADKLASIVFYSDGPTGWKSYKAAILTARAGYSNVKWLREGTSGWTAKGGALE